MNYNDKISYKLNNQASRSSFRKLSAPVPISDWLD